MCINLTLSSGSGKRLIGGVRNALRQKTFNSDLNFNSHTYFMTYLDCMNHLTEKKLGLEQQHLNGPFDSGFSLTENLFSLETTTSVIIKNLVQP